MMSSADRSILIDAVETELRKKYELLRNAMTELQEGLSSEAKSTAGDKHETGRAMLQLELEKLGNQLHEAQKNLAILNKCRFLERKSTVQSGSIVQTNKGLFFISIGLGHLKNEKAELFVISPSAPLSQLLLGKGTGMEFQWNGQMFRIEAIL